MFLIEKKEENGFEKIILKDDISGTKVEIIPSCSAMLYAFIVKNNDEEINVIDSYSSLADFKNNLTKAGFKGCKLSPFVCRLKEGKYRFGNENYTIEKYYDGPNALHGLLYDKAFDIIAENAGEENAYVSMKYSYKGTDAGYPFLYDCTVTWRLESGNRLTVITACTNKDGKSIPMQDGWHPYFSMGETINDLFMEFQSSEMVEFEELVPTGKLLKYEEFNSSKKLGNQFLDNCFTLDFNSTKPTCILRSDTQKIQLEIHPKASYPYLQIYTPPHRKSIAIENLSGPPDAFNNGMDCIIINPGETATFEVTYQLVILK